MKKIIIFWVFAVAVFSFATSAFARTYEGVEYIEAIDGDTATFAFPRTDENSKMVVLSPLPVRLWGVNSPELSEKNGELCKVVLRDILKEFSHFTLVGKGSSYGRRVAVVMGRKSVPMGDDTAFDIAKYMVYAGCAVDAPKYSKGYYREAQETAQSNKFGIWRE